MRKEIKTVQVTCDLCGGDAQDAKASVSESHPVAVMSVRHDIWYGGTWELKDFCIPCQSKLVAFLESNHAVGRGQKVS